MKAHPCLGTTVQRLLASWRPRRPTLASLLVEVPLALALISAVLLVSIASPDLW